MKKRRQKRGKRGFSLIEFEFGLGLCVIALSGILGLVSQSLDMKTTSENRVIAMNEARRVVEQVRQTIESSGQIPTDIATVVRWQDLLSNRLDNQQVAVSSLNTGLDPLHVRVALSWNEKGKRTEYAVDTIMTVRG